LAQAGVRLAAQGKTTLDEVRKIAGNEPIGNISRRFGQELIEAGIINPTQRDQAVEEQINLRRSGIIKQFGDVVVTMGFCSLEDVARVFEESRNISRRFGRELIEAGIITPAQRDQAVAEQMNLRRSGVTKRFGEVLVTMGFCSAEGVARVFEELRGAES
jgi:hypothetical protein